MRVTFILFSLLLPSLLFSGNFVSVFMDQCAVQDRPLNNVNIGKAMLDKMAANAVDEEMKAAFKELNSIRIVNTDNEEDSKYYFKKADELIRSEFNDYNEALSLREVDSKISVWIKSSSDDNQDIILVSIDALGKLSIITVSGKIDFETISKLSGSLRDGQQLPLW